MTISKSQIKPEECSQIGLLVLEEMNKHEITFTLMCMIQENVKSDLIDGAKYFFILTIAIFLFQFVFSISPFIEI